MPHFLDTNLLLYSIGSNPSESHKRFRAIELLRDDSAALSIQVFQDFYVQATRANRPDPVPYEFAIGLIEAWSRFLVQDLTRQVFNTAMRIRVAYGFLYSHHRKASAIRLRILAPSNAKQT